MAEKTESGLDENVAGLLCYIAGWITGLIFVLIEKQNKFVRFHAFQSLFMSLAIMVAYVPLFILMFIPILGWLLVSLFGLAVLALWIFCMVMAFQGKVFKLPIIGAIAAKQAGLDA